MNNFWKFGLHLFQKQLIHKSGSLFGFDWGCGAGARDLSIFAEASNLLQLLWSQSYKKSTTCNYSLFTKLLWPEDKQGTIWSVSQTATCTVPTCLPHTFEGSHPSKHAYIGPILFACCFILCVSMLSSQYRNNIGPILQNTYK